MYQCHINHLLFYNISLITYQKKKKKTICYFMLARATELGESTKYLKSLSIIAAHNIIYINN